MIKFKMEIIRGKSKFNIVHDDPVDEDVLDEQINESYKDYFSENLTDLHSWISSLNEEQKKRYYLNVLKTQEILSNTPNNPGLYTGSGARPKLPSTNAFCRSNWHGKMHSLDGSNISDFTIDDLDEVLFSGDSGGDWEGSVACICLLKDGRYISWETCYGPTGDGFCEDAYGGDADILVSSCLENAINLGLTEEGRKLCGIGVEFVSSEYEPNRS